MDFLTSKNFMNSSLISENIINDRFLNLEKSINLFIKALKKNGLAKQLQYYRASSSFDANPYVELFDEIINQQREHLILDIHQKIDHEKFLVDQSKTKVERKLQNCSSETKELRMRNEKIRQIIERFTSKINSLKDLQEQTEKSYIEKTEEVQNLINLTSFVRNQQQKRIIPFISQNLNDIKEDFANDIESSISEILPFYKMRFGSEIPSRIIQSVAQKKNNCLNDLFQLKKEIESIQNKNDEINSSIQNISDFISSFSGIEINECQNVIDHLPKIVEQLKQSIINNFLIESKNRYFQSKSKINLDNQKRSLMSEISTEPEEFGRSIKKVLEIALEKREKQFQKLEQYSRKKRLDYQKQYEKALMKLDKLNAKRPDHTEIIDEMNLSSLSFIEQSKILDNQIKLLSQSPFISKKDNI